MLRAIVFDMQGTLIHTEELAASSLEAVLVRHGLEMPDGRTMQLYRLLSPYTFLKAYYALQPDSAAIIAAEIQTEYKACYDQLIRAYNGTETVLMELKAQGLRIFAVSKQNTVSCRKALENTGLLPCIDGVYQKGERGKVLVALMSAEGLEPDAVLYVGDNIEDMDEAEQTGCGFLPCTYGYGFEQNTGMVKFPVPMLNDIRRLPDLLGEFEQGN